MNLVLKRDPVWLGSLQSPNASPTLLLHGGHGLPVSVPAPLLLAVSPLVRRILAHLPPPAYSPYSLFLPGVSEEVLHVVVDILTTGAAGDQNVNRIQDVRHVFEMLGVEGSLVDNQVESGQDGNDLNTCVKVEVSTLHDMEIPLDEENIKIEANNIENEYVAVEEFTGLRQNNQEFEEPSLKKSKTEDQNVISCSKCGKVFNSLKLLSKHKREEHLKQKTEQKPKNKTCEECNKTFFNVQYYEDHVVTFHTKAFPHLCDLCGKGFTVTAFRGRFREHRKNCQKEKRKIPERICKECDKQFPSSSSFNRHMIFHSKAKDYKCTDCEKAYADKNNLKNHVRLVHPLSAQQFKKKSRPCNLCDKRFETHTKVELHKIADHGHSYFACCEVCGKGFIRREYQRRLEVHKKKCPA